MTGLAREIARLKKQALHLSEDLRQLETIVQDSDIAPKAVEAKDLIFIEEMAEMFGRSVATLRRWMKAGRLMPFYQEGRKYYWLKSELPQVLKSDATIEN